MVSSVSRHVSESSVVCNSDNYCESSSPSAAAGGNHSKRANEDSVADKAAKYVEKQARRIRSFHQIFLSVLLFFALATMGLYHMVSETWDDRDGESLVNNLNHHMRDRYNGQRIGKLTNKEQFSLNKRNGITGKNEKKRNEINLDEIGDKSTTYKTLREEYDERYPPDDIKRLRKKADSIRKRDYLPINGEIDCPTFPPKGYPQHFNVVDVIENWPADDPAPREHIYQGMCVFDYQTDLEKAENYRKAEVPFVIRNDPAVLRPMERWDDPEYLPKLLPKNVKHRAEYSENNHFMYWNKPRKGNLPPDWHQPTEMIKMTYPEWLSKANVTE